MHIFQLFLTLEPCTLFINRFGFDYFIKGLPLIGININIYIIILPLFLYSTSDLSTMKKILLFCLLGLVFASEIDNQLGKETEKAPPPFDIKAAHKLFLLYGWTVFADILVLLMHYKHKRFMSILHGILGLGLVATTFVTALPSLLKNGFNTKHLTHYIIGVVVWGIMFFEMIIGLVSMILQWCNKTRAMPIYALKKVHTYLGFALVVLGKVQIFLILGDKRMQFWLLIAWETAVTVFYFSRLYSQKQLANVILPSIKNQIKRISSLGQLPELTNCFIFANYVYDLTPLVRTHPAGFKIIEPLKGEQVDRYLYGMYRSELYTKIPQHSHSAKSLNLAGPPKAQIAIPSAFNGFDKDIVSVKAASVKALSKHVYEVRLVKNEGFHFNFVGYTHESQLGRFYSLTMDRQTTRLYTTVNFLTDKNKCLLRKTFDYLREADDNYEADFELEDKDTAVTVSEGLEVDESSHLPLLIKKYHKGKLTKKLNYLDHHSLELSAERGFGLELGELPAGRLVVMVGGTGLFPFCDLIDLLFKEEVLKSASPQLAQQIITANPILKRKPFERFAFEFFGSFNHIDDIHKLTLFQISHLLTHSKRFSFVFKIKEDPSEEAVKSRFTLTHKRFEGLLRESIQRENLSKVFICGPPGMNHTMLKVLSEKLSKSQYIIL